MRVYIYIYRRRGARGRPPMGQVTPKSAQVRPPVSPGHPQVKPKSDPNLCL